MAEISQNDHCRRKYHKGCVMFVFPEVGEWVTQRAYGQAIWERNTPTRPVWSNLAPTLQISPIIRCAMFDLSWHFDEKLFIFFRNVAHRQV